MIAQPLRGVRVTDTGRLMPSSVATAELAALGAEVIKVEIPPYGDYVRINPPLVGGRGDMHLHLNRGKKSLCVDPRTDRGREVLDRLVSSSDVLIELSRPGAGAALGLAPDRVRSLNPRIVHCCMTGFGLDGPYRDLAAHGLSADAASGLLGLEPYGERWLLPEPYVSVGPRASGLVAAIAILGALFEVRATGQGAFLDVSQWDAAVAWNYRSLTLSANNGEHTPPYRELGPKYDAYETSDGGFILLCVPEPKLWAEFCTAIDRHDLLGRSSGAVIEYVDDDDLRAELRRVFLERTREEWIRLAIDRGLAIAPITSVDELPTDPHVLARQMLVDAPHPLGGTVRLPGFPVKGGADHPAAPAPELGQHSAEIVRLLGYDDQEISALLADGTILQAE